MHRPYLGPGAELRGNQNRVGQGHFKGSNSKGRGKFSSILIHFGGIQHFAIFGQVEKWSYFGPGMNNRKIKIHLQGVLRASFDL